MLALTEIPHGYSYEKVVVCGTVIGQKPVIAAGRSFFETYEQKVSLPPTPVQDLSEDSGDDSPQASQYRQRNKKKDQLFSGNALRLSALVGDANLYTILGVSESCSGDDIKKSYRKLVLEKHPDKQQGLPEKEAEKCRNEFLQIQEAFEVLSDDRTRRMYDSSLPFDDTIPSEKDLSDSDFISIFGAAFARNERWSVRRPVPSIGTMESSRDQVQRFYDFWFNKFETWRDFSHHDEYDLSQAESRDERRWMEVQNARIRKKKLSEENCRIRKLIDTAEKLDPRLRRFRQEDAEEVAKEKLKRQQEREERQRAADEKKKEAERAKLEKLMQEEIERDKAKMEKGEIKKIRAEIRQTISVFDNEKFNQGLIAVLSDLNIANELVVEAKKAVETNAISQFVDEIIERASGLSRTVSIASTPQEAPAPIVVESAEGWTAEEVQLLTRGMQKYPVGTNRRWEIIQGLLGGSKTVSQVIEMSKKVGAGKVVEPVELILSKSKVQQTSAPDVDYERHAKKETVEPAKETPSDEWSPEQQKQLEEAMRAFPTTLSPAERWAKIAECVTGKTRQQCVARFKYIRELIAKKK
jgi:DnaJ family protein C protein 2